MPLFAESYDRIFHLPEGDLAVMADIHAATDTLELRDLVIYPVHPGRLQIGAAALLGLLSEIEAEARTLGFRRLRITADRLTGAAPGRHIDLTRDLQ